VVLEAVQLQPRRTLPQRLLLPNPRWGFCITYVHTICIQAFDMSSMRCAVVLLSTCLMSDDQVFEVVLILFYEYVGSCQRSKVSVFFHIIAVSVQYSDRICKKILQGDQLCFFTLSNISLFTSPGSICLCAAFDALLSFIRFKCKQAWNVCLLLWT